jgi:oxygen-independent coproporphyrinogen-3 oxidase
MQRGLIRIKADYPKFGQGGRMWTYKPQHLATAAPRYTSYPTAAEFTSAVGADAQAAALAAVAPDATLSLYVHVPYCEQICWYCGCNTGAANRRSRLDVYAAALKAEIATVAERLGGRGRVASVHFGGGSPNALPAATLAGVVADLRGRFDIGSDVEVAVELDPRGLDAAYIDALAATGVGRVSLGVQTFARHVQERINRVQPFETIAAAVARLRAAGIQAINFDLMYGLPGQLVGDLVETIDLALSLAPDRLAVFGYAHLPRMLPRLAHQALVEAGYAPIGFDHFARPGDPLAAAAADGRLRRNFQGFTDDPADVLIGLGASAISDFPDLLVQNEKDAGRYRARVLGGGLAGCRGAPRSDEDRLRGAVIEALLCSGEADVAALCRARGENPSALDASIAALSPLVTDGLVDVTGRCVALRPDALPYARVVARAFDAYRAAGPARFSRAI